MTYRQVTELSLKILAFYWLFNTINLFTSGTIFNLLHDADNKREFMLFLFGHFVPNATITILLYFFAKPISKYVAPSNNDINALAVNIKATDLHYVLLSIFGFIVVTLSIIPISKHFLAIVTEVSRTPEQFFTHKALLLAYSIQLIIGIWFAFGSKGISGFIYKLRYSNR